MEGSELEGRGNDEGEEEFLVIQAAVLEGERGGKEADDEEASNEIASDELEDE
eukprot:CAMPEP_0174887112 /NCGR_PEP_ID=MMETSP0167-20121228/2344_1 /TAXON_ID=38298 /ORGANISM="Rhodella maculata, Strain CCMP736" /LENGTH=52 /DNA_ID=CAMNT_0016123429 /DNA_START=54 /DNA_END=210 /DNA_ORIENTATION=+